MYSSDAVRIVSASYQWTKASAATRNRMLVSAGHANHRTLTLRQFDALPVEVKLDLNYVATLEFDARQSAIFCEACHS